MNFILLGAAGYIAEKHLEAIRAVGGNLLAVMDPHDSVGRLDRFGFRDAAYFREFERLDRFAAKCLAEGTAIDYVSICSPNYLHDAHCRFALRLGASAICEKPLTVEPWNAEALEKLVGYDPKLYRDSGPGRFVLAGNPRINCILQMRLHPRAAALRAALTPGESHRVEIEYVTPRGEWYLHTWKAEEEKSGGLMMNLGVHLFDLLCAALGGWTKCGVVKQSQTHVQGWCLFADTGVNWRLSIDRDREPCRLFTVDGIPFDFTEGFTDLHTQSYREILAGRGFTVADALPAIRLVHSLRESAKHG